MRDKIIGNDVAYVLGTTADPMDAFARNRGALSPAVYRYVYGYCSPFAADYDEGLSLGLQIAVHSRTRVKIGDQHVG